MKNKIKELKEQANELIDLGNSREKAEGLGMMRVINVFESDKEEKEVLYVLDEDSINGIKINEKIRNEELFEYFIMDRKEFINDLIGWIAEANDSNKALMQQDLEMLINTEDEFMLSSNSTNDYIGVSDSRFSETCKELLELSESL